VTGTVGYSGSFYSFKGGSGTTGGSAVQTKYYYGLTENHAVGVDFAYSNSASTTRFDSALVENQESRTQGAGNINFGYRGDYDFGPATMYFGGIYSLSPEKSKETVISNTETENNAAGRSAYILSAAVVAPVGTFKIGGMAEYTLRQDGKSVTEDQSVPSNSTTEYTVSGGDTATVRAFGEFDNYTHTNIAIFNTRTYSSKSVWSGGESSSTGLDVLGVEVSLRFVINQNIEIIPVASYASLLNAKEKNLSDYEIFTTGVSARLLF
jgi:hypothetical protein